MDRDFVYASQGESILELLHHMDDRGVSSAPVLDIDGRPLGSATVREIESCHDIEELADHLTRSAVSVDQNTSIEAAARALAESQADSLVLVNEHGVAVGALSALDLLRAVLGLSQTEAACGKAPAAKADLAWSNAEYLELSAAHRAPEAPGLIVLSAEVDPKAERPLWAEPTLNIRERLDEMLRNPQGDEQLEALLAVYPRTVRFRCLVVYGARQRERLARALRRMVGASSRPANTAAGLAASAPTSAST
jgi:CBS domain-containing protein